LNSVNTFSWATDEDAHLALNPLPKHACFYHFSRSPAQLEVEVTMKMAMFPFLLFFKINNQPEPIKLVAMKNYYGLTLVIRMRAAKYKWVLGTIAAYQLVECATCEVNCENSEIHVDKEIQ